MVYLQDSTLTSDDYLQSSTNRTILTKAGLTYISRVIKRNDLVARRDRLRGLYQHGQIGAGTFPKKMPVS